MLYRSIIQGIHQYSPFKRLISGKYIVFLFCICPHYFPPKIQFFFFKTHINLYYLLENILYVAVVLSNICDHVLIFSILLSGRCIIFLPFLLFIKRKYRDNFEMLQQFYFNTSQCPPLSGPTRRMIPLSRSCFKFFSIAFTDN